MKRIALIHTVRSVYESFEPQLRAYMPEQALKVHNVLDEFLASDAAPTESNAFTAANKRRLLYQLLAAELTGADLIVTTCSQLSPAASEMRGLLRTPLITIDGAMIRAAVSASERIALLSSAAGTVAPVREMLMCEARAQDKTVEIQVLCNEDAIVALKRGDRAEHDRLLREMAGQIAHCGAALIAQASGAHMGPEVERIGGVPTFTSIELCLREIKAFLLAE